MLTKKWNVLICLYIALTFFCGDGASFGDQEKEVSFIESSHDVQFADCKCDNGYCEKVKNDLVCKCHSGWGLVPSTWIKSEYCKECNCGKDFNCTFTTSWGTAEKVKCLCPDGYGEVKGVCKGNCKKNPCKNSGQCIVKGVDIECKCKGPFTGKLCEKKSSDPCSSNPCKNGGKCSATGEKVTCVCPDNFTGDFCQTDKCSTIKCQNGGKCTIDKGKAICNCTDQYTGTNCKKDKCLEVACKNKGKCVIEKGKPICNCTDEFTGTNCEKNKCSSISCMNKGKCYIDKGKAACNCTERYTGDKCEKDKCSKLKCQNNGTCIIVKGKANCNCSERYTGDACEKEVCKCENGKCETVNGKLTCKCNPEFGLYKEGICKACDCGTGANCTFDPDFFFDNKKCVCPTGWLDHGGKCVDLCKPNPCKHEGICSVKEGKVNCSCKDPYVGVRCETDQCLPNPCSNNGTCNVTKGKMTCSCKDPFTGDKCERNLCLPNPCSNKGICNVTNGKINCTCKDPFTGEKCKINQCIPNPCRNDGKCDVINGKVNCSCKDHFVGDRCETELSTMGTSPSTLAPTTTTPTTNSETFKPRTTRDTTSTTNSETVTPKTTRNTTSTTNSETVTPRTTTDTTSPTSIRKPTTSAPTTVKPTTTIKLVTTRNITYTTEIVTLNVTDDVDNDTLYTTESFENGTSNTTDEIVTEPTQRTVFTTEKETFSTSESTVTSEAPTTIKEQTTATTEPEYVVCEKNPCKNGGTCIKTVNGENCICPYPYGGDVCSDSYWCTEGLGKDLCDKTKCVFDFKTRVGHCSCPEGDYYDYKNRLCQTVDRCPLMPEKCNSVGEVCRDNECHCKENFKRNSKSECIPNFCETLKKAACRENAVCEENEEDPVNVRCVCKEGYIFIGKECVKVNKCHLPGALRCQQICNLGNESCSCLPGYNLQKDNKTCSLVITKYKCSKDLNCKPGNCYKDETEKEICACPNTHIYKDGTCKDLCTAGSLPADLCPGDSCEPHPVLGFRCKCEGQWTYDSSNVTCRKKRMCSEGGATETCAKRFAKCVEEDTELGFRCQCADTDEMDSDRVCKNKCELKKYQDDCWEKMAVCDMEGSKATCKCPPFLTFSSEGTCTELAEHSYTGALPFAKTKYGSKTLYAPGVVPSSTLDYNKMRQDLRNSMQLIYGKNYKFADILSCNDTGSNLKCTVEIQFNSDPKDQIKLIGESETCIASESSTCFIPPELVLEKKYVSPDLLSQTDPCMDSIKQANCGDKQSTCNKIAGEGRNFECTCAEGFSSFGIYYPVSDRKTVIHNCQDINECLLPRACPNRTRCMNTYGSYECFCEKGFRPIDATIDPKASGCAPICVSATCGGHGKCEEDGFLTRCRCDDGYTGNDCNQKVEKVEDTKGAKVALITMSTIVIPLILFSVYMVYKYRLLMRNAEGSNYLLDDNASTISMEPLRPTST